MSDLPPLLKDPRNVDIHHLKMLSIFHFIGAGLGILGILFLLAHYAIFQTVFNDPKMWQGSHQKPPPAEILALLKWFYVIGGLWFVLSGALNLISGFFIRARKNRMFSIVVAGFNCLHVPLGTALGVFTIIVLMRDSVRELYGDR